LESREKGSWHTASVSQPGGLPNTFPCWPDRSNTWLLSNGARDFHQRGEEHLLHWNRGRRAVGIQPLSRNPAGCRPHFPAGVSAPTLGRSATVPGTPISAAKSTFILGIAGEGQSAYSLCLATRRVAEHTFLPACLLQHLAIQQRCPRPPSVRPRAQSSWESREKGNWHTASVSQPGGLPNTLFCQRVRSNAWPLSNGAREVGHRVR